MVNNLNLRTDFVKAFYKNPPLLREAGSEGEGGTKGGWGLVEILVIEGCPPAQPVAYTEDKHSTNPEQCV